MVQIRNPIFRWLTVMQFYNKKCLRIFHILRSTIIFIYYIVFYQIWLDEGQAYLYICNTFIKGYNYTKVLYQR